MVKPHLDEDLQGYHLQVMRHVNNLTPVERIVFWNRQLSPEPKRLTLCELADELKVSQSYVCILEHRAACKIRKAILLEALNKRKG